MTKVRLVAAAAALLSIAAASGGGPRLVPDPKLTPGDVIAGVTAEQVCRPGYARSVRYVPAATRRRVLMAYGMAPNARGNFELDHLIPLCLGGSNSWRNLWPEARGGDRGAEAKDRLEEELHAQVCSGRMRLGDAQFVAAHFAAEAAAR